MSRSLGEANRAISAVGDLPYGPVRCEAAEREVRRIEAEGHAEALAYALHTLVESLVWSGEVEKAYVPFTKHVRWWDTRPDLFDEQDRHALFWSFKWMVADLSDFPTVPAEQIEATIADMEHRYAVEGLGMDAVAHQRFVWAEERGVAVDEAYERWVATPRDDFSQCAACDPSDRAAHLLAVGRTQEAIDLIERTLDEGQTCATEPADMLSHLQLAYLTVGRLRDAAAAHRRAVHHLTTSTGTMAGTRGRVLQFLARVGHDDAALRRLEEERALLLGADSPARRLGFLLSAGTTTHLVRQADPDRPVDLPGTGARTVAELDVWIRAEADALAAAFDARNGTDRRARDVTEAWSAVRSDEVVPLAVVDLRGPVPADAAVRPGAGPTGTGTDSAVPAPPPGATTGATPSGHPVDELTTEARRREAAGDLTSAAALWAEASRLEELSARPEEAGLLLAEAARCALLAHDPQTATAGLARALALLAAAGTGPELAGRVARLHAELAAAAGSPGDALPTVERLLDRTAEETEALEARGASDGRATALRRERGLLLDTAARLRAEAGDLQVAVVLAEQALGVLREAGHAPDVMHTAWLVGRLHAGLDAPDQAVPYLEEAVNRSAGDREQRGAVTAELITALRAAGRHADADTVTV